MGRGPGDVRDDDIRKAPSSGDFDDGGKNPYAEDAYGRYDKQRHTLTKDETTAFRASDIEQAAAQVERGDGSGRSRMIGAIDLAKEQGVLDTALNKLEKDGKATIIRDKSGVATEIVIDPDTGPYDRGTKTIVQLGGEIKVDGRSVSQADGEKKDAALRTADAAIDSAFIRPGERPLTAAERQIAKGLNHAMIDGDGEKLASLGKELLSNPESGRRIALELEKIFSGGVIFEKGDDGREQVKIIGVPTSLVVNQEGAMRPVSYIAGPRDESMTAAALKDLSDLSIYGVNSSYDNHNVFDKERKGAVYTPEERAKIFNQQMQEFIDKQK